MPHLCRNTNNHTASGVSPQKSTLNTENSRHSNPGLLMAPSLFQVGEKYLRLPKQGNEEDSPTGLL